MKYFLSAAPLWQLPPVQIDRKFEKFDENKFPELIKNVFLELLDNKYTDWTHLYTDGLHGPLTIIIKTGVGGGIDT